MATQSADAAAGPGPGAAGAAEPDPKRWLILVVICVAQLMVVLDATIMNLALPSAQEDLGFSLANRQWIVTAYAVAFGSLLLFCGRLVLLFGLKRSFLVGLAGFAGASAVGGAANSFEMLVSARVGQGVFAALLAPATLTLLTTTFTDPKEKGKAFGAYGAVAASGAGLGLIIGGALTSGLSWRWCMYVNLLFAGVALLGAGLPFGRNAAVRSMRTKLDFPGVILVSAAMFCIVYGFSNAANEDWSTPQTWGFLVAGGVLLVAFAAWQTRAAHPLLPPRVVLDRNRSGAYLLMLLVGAGIFGFFLFLIYYMQTTLDYSAIASGVALLPMVVFTAVAVNIGNIKIMPKYGPKPLVIAGLTLNAGALVWLTRVEVDSGYAAALLGPILVLGFGMGFIFAAALQTGTTGVEPQDAGIASASIQVGQQLGGSLGTALLNTIAASAITDYVKEHAQGRPPTEELLQLAAVDSYVTVFWWCAGLFAAGAVICGLLIRSGPLPAPAFGAKPVDKAEKAPS
ncbi:Puromycin resistance protein pur8 [Streptomyces sp. CNQ-509]|uniref:MFS transporter n=1 Tax=Streptomyces sp. CNQ-509 TaxID=444103 RepID=UPI00062DF9EB|nr:MFS transporter [Streptomyces sp. CNQ-509]AKH84805.1 Puromycin resistance protein pur8 [Streptomyces sp. CNQ-509]